MLRSRRIASTIRTTSAPFIRVLTPTLAAPCLRAACAAKQKSGTTTRPHFGRLRSCGGTGTHLASRCLTSATCSGSTRTRWPSLPAVAGPAANSMPRQARQFSPRLWSPRAGQARRLKELYDTIEAASTAFSRPPAGMQPSNPLWEQRLRPDVSRPGNNATMAHGRRLSAHRSNRRFRRGGDSRPTARHADIALSC